MSKRARALVFGAMLAAMNLAGMTAIAQAHANNQDTITRHRALGQAKLGVAGDHDTPRPPLERQVGESYRNYHEALAAQAQTTEADAVEQFRRGERATQAQPANDDATQRALAERWNYYYQSTRVPPAELKAQMQAQARSDNSPETPAQVTAPVRSVEPSGQPVWLVVSLGVLAAVLALVAGLAVMAARRAGRNAPTGQAA
jgi:hypothetical protein